MCFRSSPTDSRRVIKKTEVAAEVSMEVEMAQSVVEAVPELAQFNENSSQIPMNGIQGTAAGVAPGLANDQIPSESPLHHTQTQRQVMRPSREVELALSRLDPHLVT